MIQLFIYENHNTATEFKQWKFPGGEVGVKLPAIPEGAAIRLLAMFPTSDDIMTLFNVFDALKRQSIPKRLIRLEMPYFPYARQDRVCAEGESFALEVFCGMLKTHGHFGTLCTSDVHSKVSEFLLECSEFTYINLTQGKLSSKLPSFEHLFAPDRGAIRKISQHDQVTRSYRPAWVAHFEKTRTAEGIVYIPAKHDFYQGECCVVDDICDGGETFLKLGQMLRETQPKLTILSLYVTHGIFSNDTKFKQLLEIYDTIYVKYLMNDTYQQFVKVI